MPAAMQWCIERATSLTKMSSNPIRPPRHGRSRAAVWRLRHSESVRTVIIALVANVVIAIAKLIAGLMSRSTAMLAEAAHSFADSLNEIFLAISLKRARKPPDQLHPLGHGRERFLWALMAAVASFIIGGCFSVAMAIWALMMGGETGHTLAAWIVLAVSFAADGTSWLQSVRQARRESRGRGIFRHLQRSSDPIVRAIVVEDSAALIGVLLAAGGLVVSHITGNNKADAIASLLIGVLLAFTAFALARPLADYLVGRSLPDEQLEKIRDALTASPAVEQVLSLQAVYTGPEEVIVAAKINPSTQLSSDEIARAMDDLDRTIRDASPYVADVYLDLTSIRT